MSHAQRPREIFAEDFRYLFGSDEAVFSGGIENDELSPPTRSRRDFIEDLVDSPRRAAASGN
jgi:hypothetical protein